MAKYTHKTSYLARTNELVSCPNGHKVCEVAVDITLGSIMRREQFKQFYQPGNTDKPMPCVVCGEHWIRRNRITGRFQIFVGNGWRPKYDESQYLEPSERLGPIFGLRGMQ